MSKKKYLDLLKEIRKHDHLYFDQNAPEISDYDYDLLVEQVKHIEAQHPEWAVTDNPTKKVSGQPSKGFAQRTHTVPMLSLANTYSREEVAHFVDRVCKQLGQKRVGFYVELKLDGVAIALRYEKGTCTCAISRGNGRRGDDITANVKTIRSIPHAIKGGTYSLEVRGEVFMPLQSFAHLNEERIERGLEPWANPRNAAAGSLKLLDPKEVAKRCLRAEFYQVLFTDKRLKSQAEVHTFLKELNLPVARKDHVALCYSTDEIFAFINRMEEKRCLLPFEIDGVVIKVNALHAHDIMGATSKSPRWAVAYKFSPEQIETVIQDITVQVGRTGVLTPVAELLPIPLAGSTLSRATLHNEEEILRKDIRIKDTVIVEKGGDVIPKVVKVIKNKRPENARAWRMPTHCPICGSAVVRESGFVAIRCPNRKGCGGQLLRRISFFVSKSAMDIDHLGPKIVKKLVEMGLISSVSDIYRIEREALVQVEGFREKSIDNLLSSIKCSKQIPLHRFIFALGIPYVGENMAQLLADAAINIETLKAMTLEELCAIDGIGAKVASSIIHFFSEHKHLKEIDALIALGVTPVHVAQTRTDHPFSGKTFVLSGTLNTWTRSEATDQIKKRGGRVAHSISEKTDFLLLGKSPGSKYAKARKLNIEILDEERFHSLL